MSGIPTLNPIGAGQLPVAPMWPESIPNTYMFSPVSGGSASGGSVLGSLASAAGPIGSVVGAGLNLLGAHLQNEQQENFYNQYQSPQAQMRQMIAAGINPNTAAAAIAGHGPAQMTAASTSQLGSAAAQGAGAGADIYGALTQGRSVDVQERVADAEIENINADTELKQSQNVGQVIENENRQTTIDKTLRSMDDKHLIDGYTANMLRNDSALSDILFTGKITQFWLNISQMAQDLMNAQKEHDNIIADINKKYSEANLNLELAQESDERQRNIAKDTEIKEEERRYKTFRRNMISKYHFDPNSTTEQNIAFAMSVGDYETATYLAHGLGRLQADVHGYKVDKENVLNQENMGLQGMIDIAKYCAGGAAIGSAGNKSRVPSGANYKNIPGAKTPQHPFTYLQGSSTVNPITHPGH